LTLISNRFLSSTFLMATFFAMILCSGQLSINSYGFSSSVNNSVKDPFAKPDQIIFDFFPSDTEKESATTDSLSSPMLNSLFQGVDSREVCGDNKDNNKNGLVDENCIALPSDQQNSLGQLPPSNSIDGLSDLPQNDNQNPEPEICGDGQDNDGNGDVDENCSALPSDQQNSLGQLPPPPNSIDGLSDLPQNDNQNPEPEICGDGEDNNGNGAVDENCNNQPPGGDDNQNPEPEICGDGEDNNGNGEVDEDCNNQSPGGDDNSNPEPEICGDGEDNNGNGIVDENC
jgi:hypothetical protein